MKRKLADFYTPQPSKQQNTNTETAELSLLASIETTASTDTFLDPTMTDELRSRMTLGLLLEKLPSSPIMISYTYLATDLSLETISSGLIKTGQAK